jgi:RHS repeat-associated protein
LIITRGRGGYINSIITPEGEITFNHYYSSVENGGVIRTDSVVDWSGREVIYTYETHPFNTITRLKKVTYPDGNTLEYQYDSEGRMSGIINGRGILEVFNEYYPDDPEDPYQKYRVQRQTLADGGTYEFIYTLAGGLITETTMLAPNGAETTWGFYDYDTRSIFYDKNITYLITPDGTTIYERDEDTNNLISVTDALNRKTIFTYYSNGLDETVRDNFGNIITSYEYEPLYGLPTKITNALGKDTTYIYTYDANDKITKVEIRDPLQNLTTFEYNSNGMPISRTDPNNITVNLTYDPIRPSEVISVSDQLGNTSTFSYDSAGRLETETDANGLSSKYTYDPMNRITSAKDPLSETTRFIYDTNGNLSKVINAKGNWLRYEYDERDRISKITDQLGREETFTYYTGAEITPTTGDNLKSITDRKGQTTIFHEYDLMNRIKRKIYNDSSYTEYTYDTVGRVDIIDDSISGEISYTYSDTGCSAGCNWIADRMTEEVTPLGVISYTYDEIGRITSMTVSGQPTVNYTYDDAGRLINISRDINGTVKNFNITYDNGSRRTQLQVPLYKVGRGKKAYWEYLTTTYSYDIANRLLNMNHQGPSSIIEDVFYEYDPNGNRTEFTRNAPQTLRSDSASSPCGTNTYEFDVRNRLVGINGFDDQCFPLSASFKYDALGRRIEKTVNGVTTQYVYDGLDIIQEIENGQVTVNYIRTFNIDEALARIESDGTVRYYLTDALGSVIALTDENGNVTTTYTYDPFGSVTISGEPTDNPFQYIGRENDGTGLYYYRARYYSPELQRFISEDPIGLDGGDINFYSYAHNNPVNFTDPFGLRNLPPPPRNPPLQPTGLPVPPTHGPHPPHPHGPCYRVTMNVCLVTSCSGLEVPKGGAYMSPELHKTCVCVEWGFRSFWKCPDRTFQ